MIVDYGPTLYALVEPGDDDFLFPPGQRKIPDVAVYHRGPEAPASVAAWSPQLDVTPLILDARSAVAEALARIDGQVAEVAAESPEAAAARAAWEKFDAARGELAIVIAREAAARSERTAALAAGNDPRPYAIAIETAARETADVGAWVEVLQGNHKTTSAAVDRLKARLRSGLAAAELDAVRVDRAALRDRVVRTIRDLTADVIRLAEAEAVLKPLAPPPPSDPAPPTGLSAAVVGPPFTLWHCPVGGGWRPVSGHPTEGNARGEMARAEGSGEWAVYRGVGVPESIDRPVARRTVVGD